jgi:hypothetical protein
MRQRKYFFAESFKRVTGLICQVQRGNATFFFFDFILATDETRIEHRIVLFGKSVFHLCLIRG